MPQSIMVTQGPWPLFLAENRVGSKEFASPALPLEEQDRLVDLVGDAMAQHLLSPFGVELPTENVTRSRLSNRFRRIDGLKWARHASDHDVPVVCLKGLAATHLLYPDPDLRAMSDADLLVDERDLDRLSDIYAAAGLTPHETEGRSPWGHISDASLYPLSGSDGASNVDLHIHPDAWPVHLGLSCADVFASARSIAAGEGEILVPSYTHMLLLSACHAARDLFGPSTAKSLLDAGRLLQQFGNQVDWQEFQDRLVSGRSQKPVRAFLAILHRLGADTSTVPEAIRRSPAGTEFERAVDDYIRLFPDDLGMLGRARRELSLCAEPGVAMRRNWLRLLGLVRRVTG